MSDTATPPINPDILTFDVTVTLEDQLALQLRCLATPAMRAGQRRRTVATVLVAAAWGPVALIGGILLASANDPQGLSLGSMVRTLVLDQPGILIASMLVMVGIAVCSIALRRWRVRPRLRRVLRRMLREQPDVNPSDPQLAFRACVTVDDEGLQSRTGTGLLLVGWGVLKRWEETGGRIIVLGNAMAGFCLPTFGVDPGLLDRLRAVLTARLGPSGK